MIRLNNILNESLVTTTSFLDLLKYFENSIKRGWDKEKKKWFPHGSLEGGTDTIAYGHKMKSTDDYSQGITEKEATTLLLMDVSKAISKIKNTLGINFNTLPKYVKQALN